MMITQVTSFIDQRFVLLRFYYADYFWAIDEVRVKTSVLLYDVDCIK